MDPSDSSMYVVYANSGRFVIGLETETGATMRQQVDLTAGTKVGGPDTLVDKPFVGGMTVDGNFLVTGYSDAAFYDLQNSLLTLVNSGEQVCNAAASVDPANPNLMLFLNFQGEQNMTGDPTGAVGQHHIIYFLDNTNTYQDHIAVPTGIPEWQDPEWSTHPDYIVALGGEPAGPQHVYIIRRSDKAVFKITEGLTLNDTSTPHLWVGS
ncbi:hypothetical protein ACFL5V_10240 [Fibrobacterota bacterium]